MGIQSFISWLIVFVVVISCKEKSKTYEPIFIEGHTMGTTYHVTYFDDFNRDLKNSVDSLLTLVNKSINNYDSTSEVSIFNNSTTGINFNLPYLYRPMQKANEVFITSKGAFDLTVMPLVNAWGFGSKKFSNPTKHQIDSIRNFVGFNKIIITEKGISKSDPRVQLDFGGIGQGYGADVIADFLRSKGIHNLLVELGGEGIAFGENLKKNKPWEIGILDPNSTVENQFFKAYVSLTDKSFTTSGNYFNYKIIDGKKFGHTIDPASGYPVQHELLSASVFAKDCITADAWATALMVMGLEKSITFLNVNSSLDAILIYSKPDGNIETYITPGIKSAVRLEQP